MHRYYSFVSKAYHIPCVNDSDKKNISQNSAYRSWNCILNDHAYKATWTLKSLIIFSIRLNMRGKCSKKYRKLMEQFSMTFGFREPYQVLVDADIILDSCRFKMELEPALQRTLHGKVKPMITQCEIRKLYARKHEPGVDNAIEAAKACERRRCGHHPDNYPEPLSTAECLLSVVDPKGKGENKHRYAVASQSQEVRRMLRYVRGVPLIYIRRSVMILEPMSDESVQTRAREERSKFRVEIKTVLGKRKRFDEEKEKGAEVSQPTYVEGIINGCSGATTKPKHKKKRGPKGPNPLSVKKPKKTRTNLQEKRTDNIETPADDSLTTKRRRRKDKGDDNTTGRKVQSVQIADATGDGASYVG